MDAVKVRGYLWRLVLFMLLTVILHTGYELWPHFPMELIFATDESVFQHWKILYYAYALVLVVEYVLQRRSGSVGEEWAYPRLMSLLMIPWLTFLIWYLVFAFIGGPFDQLWVEIAWANVSVLLVGIIALRLQDTFGSMSFDINARLILVSLNLIMVFYFTVFTYEVPFADVFTEVTLEHLIPSYLFPMGG